MFLETFETLVAVGLLALLLLYGGLWLFWDWRDRQLVAPRPFRVFACVRCRTIFRHDGLEEVADCPACRFRNQRLSF